MIGGMTLRKSDVKTFEFKVSTEKEKKKDKELESQIMSVEAAAPFLYQDRNSSLPVPQASSPQMQELSMNMRELVGFLSGKAPEIVNTDSLEQGCETAERIYDNIIKNAELCLQKPECYGRNGETERQLKRLVESCRKEASIFRNKVEEYQAMMQPSETGKIAPTGNWMDILCYAKSLVYQVGNENGSTIKKTGGGSMYYRIERQGMDNKNGVLFRKQEDVPSEKTKELIRQYYRNLPRETKHRKERREIFEALLADQRAGKIGEVSFDKFYSSLRREPTRNVYRKITATDTKTGALLKAYQPELALSFCDMLKGVSQTIFYRTLANRNGIEGGRNLSNRTVAASRFADLLDIGDMVEESESAVVREGDKYMRGSTLENPEGESASELENRSTLTGQQVSYSPRAVSQIFSMQIFDLLCGRTGRQSDSVRLRSEEQGSGIVVTGLKATENEMAFGTLRYDDVRNGTGTLRAANDMNLKGVPVALLNKIMRLDESVMKHSLCDILNTKELDAMADRLRGLKRRIAALPGLTMDERGRYTYTGAEGSDPVRQAAQLRRMKDTLPDDKGMQDVSGFYDRFLDGTLDNGFGEE